MSEKILGIDLGTSNSAACVYIDGKATMIPSAEGTSLYGKAFPSYVSFTENGEQLVGEPAKRQATINPDNTISEIKRHMGTDYKVNIQGKEYTPQEISAMILQKIKRDAESFLGEPVSKAVVPDLIGKTAAECNRLLVDSGLNIKIVGENINYPETLSTAQSITAGTEVDKMTVVTVTFG